MIFFSTPPSIVLIVNPLNAIITEQRTRFADRCVVLDHAFSEHRLQTILNSSVRFLIGHPEEFVSEKVMRFLRDNKKLADQVNWYVIHALYVSSNHDIIIVRFFFSSSSFEVCILHHHDYGLVHSTVNIVLSWGHEAWGPRPMLIQYSPW